jgi:hypothetical protein
MTCTTRAEWEGGWPALLRPVYRYVWQGEGIGARFLLSLYGADGYWQLTISDCLSSTSYASIFSFIRLAGLVRVGVRDLFIL